MRKFFLHGLLSVLCAASLVMVLPGTKTEVHAEDTYTITINNSETGHTYTAYQIFTGDLYEKTETVGENTVTKKILSNVIKGNNLTSESALVTALLADNTLKNKAGIKNLSSSSSAADIAEAIDTANLTADETIALSKVLNAQKSGTGAELDYNDSSKVYIKDGFAAGYYLITDGKNDGSSATNFSSLILEVVSDVNIEPKTGTPQLVKKVYDDGYNQNDSITLNNQSISLGNGFNDVTDAALWDDITFEVFSTLPDNYDSYDSYYYTLIDTLDPSLAPYIDAKYGVYLPSNTISDPNYTPPSSTISSWINRLNSTYYTVKYKNPGDSSWTTINSHDESSVKNTFDTLVIEPTSENDYYRIVIRFPDLKKVSGVTKDTIFKFTYTVLFTNRAETGNAKGNKNAAKISYSNNPQDSSSITETPTDTNVVLTYELDLTKVSTVKDSEGNDINLAGATFALYGYIDLRSSSPTYATIGDDTSSGFTKLSLLFEANSNSITTDSSGRVLPEYWEYYEKTDTPVYRNDLFYGSYGTHHLTTDSNGSIKIKGLDSGIAYYLEEIEAPDGYNKLTSPIKIVIQPNQKVNTQNYLNSMDSNATLITSTSGVLTGLTGSVYPKTNTSGTYVEDTSIAELDSANTNASTGVVAVKVKNTPGSVLPSTGGIGTTIFYIGGGAIIIFAVVMLIMRRKK